MASLLDDATDRFIAAIAPALVAVSRGSVPEAKLHADAAVEAHALVSAVIDSDGRHSDDELWAYLRTFGARLPTRLAAAAPSDVRAGGWLEGTRRWLAGPSELLRLLLDADRRDGTRHAWGYYERAVDLAFAVAALDQHTSQDELAAVEAWRARVLAALRDAGVAGPPPVPGAGVAAGQPDTAGPAAEPLPPARPLEEVLADLDGLVGLRSVKEEVKLVAALLRVQQLRREREMPVADSSRHLVFTGNPGTGKTTVARLLAEIYRSLGVVQRGHLVETDRSQLVAGYIGQTAIRVREVFDRARHGVLLIDEAYALIRGGERDFGQEAIDTIVKLVEDRRGDTVVIAAGYPDEMELFLASNPGLRSRFPKVVFFPDYSTDELLAIFDLIAGGADYALAPDARALLRALLDAAPRDRGFGNGRLVRNLFEAAVARQALRVSAMEEPSDEDLRLLLPEDLPASA